MIAFDRIEGASDLLQNIAPDIADYPLLWRPILAKQATYREVFIDDVYDLVDLERMCAASEYQNAASGYQSFVLAEEMKAKK